MKNETSIMTKQQTALHELIVACLIGPGYIEQYNHDYQCVIPINNVNKGRLIKRFKERNQLDELVTINANSFECYIKIDPETYSLYELWYKEQTNKQPYVHHIKEKVILLALLLFGEKKQLHLKLDTISVHSHNKLLSYYLSKVLDIHVESTRDGVKLYDCKHIFLLATKHFSIDDLNEFSFFLSSLEKREISYIFQDYTYHYLR